MSQAHDELQRHKLDQSRQRYLAGWPETRGLYDTTARIASGQVLDVGCGQALLGELLWSHDGIEYTGVDSWPVTLSEARRDIRTMPAWAEALPFGDDVFDTVVLGEVLEHVEDLGPVVDEALRVLKSGGILIVHVPSREREPNGAHVRVFRSCAEVTGLFDGVDWGSSFEIEDRFWFAWGHKV